MATFTDAWSSSLLHSVLKETCQKNLSLLTYVHTAQQRLLFPLAQQIVSILCSNYALEGILEMQAQKEYESTIRGELLRLLVQAITPNPSLSRHVVNYSPTFEHQNPSRTVLFDFIASRLRDLLTESEEQLSQLKDYATPYAQQFSDLFHHLVSENSIHSALLLIEATPDLMNSFLYDFFTRSLHLSPLPNDWIPAIAGFITQIVENLGIQTKSRIIGFSLAVHLQREIIQNLCILITPLLILNNPLDLLNKITNSDFEFHSWEQLRAFLWDHIAAEMWARILEIDQNELNNWISVFRLLHNLAPYHISLLGVLSHSRILQWDLLTIWYFFLVTFSYRIQLPTRKLLARISLEKEYIGLKTLEKVIVHFCDLILGYNIF